MTQTEIKTPLAGRTLAIILGMHRSGTSALTACLHAMGVWAGREEELLGATAENARGYWELRGLVEFNEALLTALGTTWDAPVLPSVAVLDSKSLVQFAQRAQALLQEAFGDAPALVMKDPRMCRLLDFWIPQFEQAGLQVRYVLALRDPQEVAASIHRRDKLPLSMARWLWADHMAGACVQTEGRERLVVSYARLLADPQQELTRLATFLGLPPNRVSANALSQIDPALRHHLSDSTLGLAQAHAGDEPRDDGKALQDIDQRLYEALLPLAAQSTPSQGGVSENWLAPCDAVRQLRAGPHHTALDVLPRGGIPAVKTAVVLHLFYPEQWPQFLALWERVWPDVDLFVTVSGPEAGRAKALVQCSAPKARVFEVPNRGRDVAAFLRVLPVLLQEGYVCACKLHTKRSDYADSDGLGWRLDLWQGLLCGGEETERLRALFAANSAIGLLGLNDYWVSVQNYRDSHHERVRELAQRLMPEQREDDWHFFAGTMFWFRPQALSPLLELGLDIEAFEPEHGQREGTLAHAIERVVALAARAGGHMVSLFTPGRPPKHLPVAFARNTTEQLFDELRQIRDRLSATESALKEAQNLALERMEEVKRTELALAKAQKLALERMEEVKRTELALAKAQKLALDRMEEVQTLDAALSQTQKLALERQQIIEAFQQSLPGRAYQLLRRTKQ